jgi:hypothetical protein
MFDARKIYNAWRESGLSWQKFWPAKQHAKPSLPEMPELPEAAVAAAPEAKIAEPEVSEKFDMANFVAKAELIAVSKERDDLMVALDKVTASLEQLERSLGLNATSTVIPMPNGGGEGGRSLIDIYNQLEGDSKTLFFRQHRDELLKFVNKPSQS